MLTDLQGGPDEEDLEGADLVVLDEEVVGAEDEARDGRQRHSQRPGKPLECRLLFYPKTYILHLASLELWLITSTIVIVLVA